MSLGPLITEVVVTFIVAACLLYRYGNWYKHHIIVTISVLIAWYFSFLIIFVLPLDVSSTVYRQCVQSLNATTAPLLAENNGSAANGTDIPTCQVPWSHVPDSVFPHLWRVVYWTSQCLTWLILPLMQSYTKAGDFTVRGKLRSALIDNAIYYSTYLFICGILLIYIALKPGLDLDGQKLKAIASSASNTWGLFLLVLLLGHALVEVPRSLWRASSCLHSLSRAYFRVAKLSAERSEAEEGVDDTLEALQAVTMSVGPGHYLHSHLETILQKIPPELRDRMARRPLPDDACPAEPTEKSLVKLHKQVKRALQMQHRTEAQWDILIEDVQRLEDASRFAGLHARVTPVWPPSQSWYWWGKELALKGAAIGAGVLSACVVWSEVTFFNIKPVLSIFARIVNLAKADYDYFTIEVISTLVIAYLCFCAYSTVFKVRVLNFYYLAGHHGTDEYSLIFSGMMLCRLTPPMCLNFLGLIHMDSHVIRTHVLETHYTQVMGHMDVIAIVSDGFNIYFPTVLLLLSVATYFSLGSRLLSALGFHQFVSGDDEMTADLVEEGRDLVKREKRRRQRTEETSTRRREFQERFGTLGLRRSRAEDRGKSRLSCSRCFTCPSLAPSLCCWLKPEPELGTACWHKNRVCPDNETCHHDAACHDAVSVDCKQTEDSILSGTSVDKHIDDKTNPNAVTVCLHENNPSNGEPSQNKTDNISNDNIKTDTNTICSLDDKTHNKPNVSSKLHDKKTLSCHKEADVITPNVSSLCWPSTRRRERYGICPGCVIARRGATRLQLGVRSDQSEDKRSSPHQSEARSRSGDSREAENQPTAEGSL